MTLSHFRKLSCMKRGEEMYRSKKLFLLLSIMILLVGGAVSRRTMDSS